MSGTVDPNTIRVSDEDGPAGGVSRPRHRDRGRKRWRGRGIGRLVTRRLTFLVPILLVVSFVLFALGAASPFDPVRQYLGTEAFTAGAETYQRIHENLGLDQPFWLRWWDWLTNALTGDLGVSFSMRQPVAQVLAERVGWTVLLVGVAFVGALLLGLVLGTVCAHWYGSLFDRITCGLAYTLQASPVFWLALLAVWLFAVQLGWLPSGGLSDAQSATVTLPGLLYHLLLPASVLLVSQTPWLLLYVRQEMSSALTEDFATGAQARGVRTHVVLLRHALPTALLSWLTLVGTRLPELITGAVLVETVFSWPGVAGATVQAAKSVDFPLLAALTMLATLTVVLGNLLADVLYTVVDPRVVADG